MGCIVQAEADSAIPLLQKHPEGIVQLLTQVTIAPIEDVKLKKQRKPHTFSKALFSKGSLRTRKMVIIEASFLDVNLPRST